MDLLVIFLCGVCVCFFLEFVSLIMLSTTNLHMKLKILGETYALVVYYDK